ncbi:MAG: hypothetical protein M3271_10735, partial [Actinomycetota bacterium]|nr:hypothetical protein [Actinomycetota bacterium]
DDITAELRAIAVSPDRSMTIVRSAFASEFVQAFFDSVVGAPQLVVTNTTGPTVTLNSVCVSGTADFGGYAGTTFTLTFDAGADDAMTVTATAKLAISAPIKLPVVTWIALSDVTLVTTYSQPYGIVTLAFEASIVLEGDSEASIPLEIVCVGPSTWQIGVAEGTTKGVQPGQLVTLIGGRELTDLQLTDFLPAELESVLECFTLNGFSVSFDIDQKTVDYLSTGFTVTNGWQAVPGFLELDPGMQLLIAITDVTDPDARDVVVVVKATFEIDGVKTRLFLQADSAGDTTSWIAGLDPESPGVEIPTLAGLFTAAGGQGFADALPDALKTLPGIQVSKLEVDFTLSPAGLQRFTFAASTTSSWTVVDGFLEIEQLELSLDLVEPGPQGKTAATIGGTFSITDAVWLFFVVDKPLDSTDWTLTGGLPPGHTFALGDLVASLLKDLVTIPPNVPSLTFDTLTASVVPGESATFSAGSQTPWPLIKGVTLDAFTLTFSYDTTAAQPFTGSLSTAVTIAGVDVSVDAALGASGAWSFEGKTKPGDTIDVTRLISDLENTFGVSGVPRDALKSLTLEDLDVRFDSGTSSGPPSTFHLGCTGKLHLAGEDFSATVAVDLAHGPSGYTGAFTGTLQVAHGDATSETFSFVLDSNGTMKAHWAAEGAAQGLSLGDVAAAFGFQVPEGVPSELNPILTSVDLDYDFGTGALLLSVQTSSGGGAVLVSRMSADHAPVRLWAFGLDLHVGITLGDLPLVGDKLGDAQQLGIPDLGLWVTSKPLATAEAKLLNGVFGGFQPALPEQDATGRIYASGELSLGTETFPLQLPLGGDPPPHPASGATAPATA